MKTTSAILLFLFGMHVCVLAQLKQHPNVHPNDTAKARALTILFDQLLAGNSSEKELDTALEYGHLITQILKGHRDTKWIAGIHQKLANIYSNRKVIHKAEEELLKALELLRAEGKTEFYLAHISLADLFLDTGSLNKALHHCLESLKGIEILKDNDLARQAHYTIAIVYRNTGRFKEAINHYEEAARICKLQSIPEGYSECRANVVNTMLKMNRPREALAYAQQLERDNRPTTLRYNLLYANMYGDCTSNQDSMKLRKNIICGCWN